MHGPEPRVVSLADYEAAARERLAAETFAYLSGGSWDEVTLRANVEAFRAYRLRPRVLVDVADVDASCNVLGTKMALPAGLAPAALQAVVHPEGELATARGAARAGALMCLSTMSSRSIEEVAAGADGPKWFQLYVHKDRAVAEDLVRRAASSGYGAIVVTVDLPVPGHRERELRHPLRYEPGWFANLPAPPAGARLVDVIDAVIDPTLTWNDLDWVRGLTDLPVVIKGILTGEDAVLALRRGVDGIIVSNHGGRQLDRTAATIDVLAEVVDAVSGRAEVYLDGGVRRGTDVVTALALGARAVFIGRPYLYALAAAGADGVVDALRLLRAETEAAMRLVGVTRLQDLSRRHVIPPA